MEERGGVQKRTTAAERGAWVSRWTRSGQSAREQELSEHSLGRWIRQAQIAGKASKSKEGAQGFHTVTLAQGAESVWGAELELRAGRCLRIRTGAPAGWIGELVEALR